MDLPIGVRLRDMVEVDQRDASDRGARKRFGSPRTDATDSDDGYVSLVQARGACGAIQSRDATETALEIGRGENVGLGHGAR
jgi:hypothetical protein